MKVAIYIRVSTKRQVDKYSPIEQRRILTEFAQSKEWEIHDYYSDLGESGTDTEREELDRLLIDANRRLFSKVLLFEQDRLSRLEQLDWAYLANSLAKLDIKLVTPTSEINLDNEEDRFLADLFNLLANRELKKTKKRTSMGRRAANKAGVFFGHAPFGFSIDRDKQLWSVNSSESEIIKLMFKWFSIDFGFRNIASKLNESGYKSKYGYKFNAATVARSLRNPAVIGEFEQTVLGETNRVKIKWESGHGPIIDADQFYRVQGIISERGESGYFREPTFLLAGLLACEECGRKFKGLGNLSVLAGGRTKKYYYYAHKNALKIKCSIRFKMSTIDNEVKDKIKRLMGSPEEVSRLLHSNAKQENTDALKAQLSKCRAERDKLISKKGRLLDLYMGDSSWTKEELDEQKKKLDDEVKKINNREQDLEGKIQASSKIFMDADELASALMIFKDFEKELTMTEQNKLLKEFISEIVIKKDGDMQLNLRPNLGKNFV